MSWTYSQKTGALKDASGKLWGYGFAGQQIGLNNPDAEDQKNIGPLPQGKYTMTKWFALHPRVGAAAIELTPDLSNQMFGRSEFFIHGLDIMDPLHSSEGCMVFGGSTQRLAIWESTDHDLLVTQ